MEVDVNIYTNKMTTENQLFASLIEKEGAIREKSVNTNTVEETQTLQTRIHKDQDIRKMKGKKIYTPEDKMFKILKIGS